jgi:hypothetical protein
MCKVKRQNGPESQYTGSHRRHTGFTPGSKYEKGRQKREYPLMSEKPEKRACGN